MTEPTVQICRKCKKEKQLECFYKDTNIKAGISNAEFEMERD